MSWFARFNPFGKKSSKDIQNEIDALNTKCETDKAALQTKLQEAQKAEAAQPPEASASNGTADLEGGRRRRKHKGGRHTKRHHKKSRSKRARTGRKSSRL